MRSDVQNILNKHNLKIELKGYKEMGGHDGYHMQGNLYVNGKKAILCEDMGMGGELDIMIVKNEFALPLLNAQDDLAKLKAYPDSKTIGDLPYTIETMFYEMVEDHVNNKDMRKHAKKWTLIKWEDQVYNGEYGTIEVPYSVRVIAHLIKKLGEKNHASIELWNPTESWETYTVKGLEKLLTAMVPAPSTAKVA